MEDRLSLEFLRVVEQAAIAAARTMGLGDRHKADEVAVEAMRKAMDPVRMDGTIVIGEGERDEAPMLFIGEKVGAAVHDKSRQYRRRGYRRGPARGDESLRHGRAKRHRRAGGQRARRPAARARPLHGENRGGAGLPRRGGTGRALRRIISAQLPSVWGATLKTLWLVVLERPRHEKLISDIRATGARIRLIGDGDLSAGISAAVVGAGVHAVMGPEALPREY